MHFPVVLFIFDTHKKRDCLSRQSLFLCRLFLSIFLPRQGSCFAIYPQLPTPLTHRNVVLLTCTSAVKKQYRHKRQHLQKSLQRRVALFDDIFSFQLFSRLFCFLINPINRKHKTIFGISIKIPTPQHMRPVMQNWLGRTKAHPVQILTRIGKILPNHKIIQLQLRLLFFLI